MSSTEVEDALAVAKNLLAFFRNPVPLRPGFVDGTLQIMGGQYILRFAQHKFPPEIADRLTPGELEKWYEAAQFFIRQICLREGASHYQLLCAAPDIDADGLKEQYRLIMALIHPDRQDITEVAWPGSSAQRVNLAYETLSNEEKRGNYDAKLTKSLHSLDGIRQPFSFPTDSPRAPVTLRLGKVARPALFASAIVAVTLFASQQWLFDTSNAQYDLIDRVSSNASESNYLRKYHQEPGRPKFIDAAGADAQSVAHKTSDVWDFTKKPAGDSVARTSSSTETPQAPTSPGKLPPVLFQPAASDPSISKSLSGATSATASRASAKKDVASIIPIDEIDAMTFQIVNFYETGDLNSLVALLDAQAYSPASIATIRQQLNAFFKATRERQLRIASGTWKTTPQGVQLVGTSSIVTLAAADGQPAKRETPLEIEFRKSNGKLGIAKLVLFPIQN